jgi:hypothetical protein
MTLSELLDKLDGQDDEATIFVDRSAALNANSSAVVVNSDMGSPPDWMSNLLEVYLAKEVLEVWAKWHDGRQPSLMEKCRAVIWYAEHDAYLPVEADH